MQVILNVNPLNKKIVWKERRKKSGDSKAGGEQS
jgi:hypothetical protein